MFNRTLKTAIVALCGLTVLALPAPDWQLQTTGTHVSLRGLSVVNDKIVWTSGSNGTYLRSVSAPPSSSAARSGWDIGTLPDAEQLDFRGIKAFDANSAIVMSSGPAEQGRARIYRTTDAGRNWSLVYSTSTPGVFLDAIAFWDKDHGIVLGDPAGGRFFLLTTDDGGKTWQQTPSAPAALPNEGAFAASNTCLAVQGRNNVWFATGGAGAGRVFHSTDRGRTWTVAATPINADTASAGVFSLAFWHSLHGIAVGGDYKQPTSSSTNVALTSDGGRTWTLAAAPPAGLYLSAVAYSPTGKGKQIIAVGSSGWASSSDGGQHWQKRGDDGFNAVSFSPSGATWAAGPDGRIAVLPAPSY